MKKQLLITAILLFSISMIFTSCTKDDTKDPVLPTITLNTGAGYIAANAQAAYGDTLKFGLNLAFNNTDNLVKVKVSRNAATFLDSTINMTTFVMDVVSTKTTDAQEVWVFEVTDIAGNVNSANITITGNFGAINTYSSITLGAQDNATIPSFLSYTGGVYTTYMQSEAFNNQANIDMFCFYEDTPGHQNFMTLAAPGSNITGIFTGVTSPEMYTTKNLTFFVKTAMLPAAFDAVTNDALVISSFDPANKFKKAKVLAVGDVYAFQIQSGKYGLLKVVAVTGTTDGSAQFEVKIQQ